jgi:hypothetical protein
MRIKWICLLLVATATLGADRPGPLPQSSLWDFPASIVDDQYRELRDFYERQITQAVAGREAFSRKAPEAQRKLLRELTGVIDQPLPPVPVRVALGETAEYQAYLVNWRSCGWGMRRPRVAQRERWYAATESCSNRSPPDSGRR